jgi:DNA-directed RNA polymerase specialized sigma24 family protein
MNGRAEQTDGALLRAFLSRNDQVAFEVLLRRHGPMVLRVCQRSLGNVHDAEDALQATFLLLARQAGSIRKRESLAGWLHGVAYRMIQNARRGAAPAAPP